MVNEELVDYVKTELRKKVSEDRIRVSLFKKKWSESEIEISLQNAKEELRREGKKEDLSALKKEVEQLKKQVIEKTQKEQKTEIRACMRKKPLLAGLLSLCLVGLGQFYNGQIQKGIVFLLSYVLWLSGSGYYFYKIIQTGIQKALAEQGTLMTVKASTKIGAFAILLIDIGIIAASMIDAYREAKLINEKVEKVL